MAVYGEGKQGILIIGESPSKMEEIQGIPFCGPAGELLQQELSRNGISLRRDCWTTNAVICCPYGDVKNRDGQIERKPRNPEIREIEHCRPNIIREITQRKPEKILLLGAAAVKSVIGWLWKGEGSDENSKAGKKGDKMGKWVGWRIPSQRLNAYICPIYHPSFVLHTDRDKPTKENDLRRLFFSQQLERALAKSGRPWKETPNWLSKCITVQDDREAAKLVRTMTAAGQPLAFDYETDRLKPDHKDARILSCSVSDGRTSVAFPWYGESVKATSEMIQNKIPKIAQNIKFEFRWTLKTLGFPINNAAFDTMLAAHVLDNRPGITGLKFQAFVTLGVDPYNEFVLPYMKSKDDSSNGVNRLPELIKESGYEKLLQYNAMDSLLEWKLAKIQMKRLGIVL